MDDDLTGMLRNNPPDVVFSAFSEVFFKGAIKMFQRDNDMRSIVLSDTEARDQATHRSVLVDDEAVFESPPAAAACNTSERRRGPLPVVQTVSAPIRHSPLLPLKGRRVDGGPA